MPNLLVLEPNQCKLKKETNTVNGSEPNIPMFKADVKPTQQHFLYPIMLQKDYIAEARLKPIKTA